MTKDVVSLCKRWSVWKKQKDIQREWRNTGEKNYIGSFLSPFAKYFHIVSFNTVDAIVILTLQMKIRRQKNVSLEMVEPELRSNFSNL